MSRRLPVLALTLVALVPTAAACAAGSGSTDPADPPTAVVVSAPAATPVTTGAPAASATASATLQSRVEAELAATDRALADADTAIAAPAG